MSNCIMVQDITEVPDRYTDEQKDAYEQFIRYELRLNFPMDADDGLSLTSNNECWDLSSRVERFRVPKGNGIRTTRHWVYQLYARHRVSRVGAKYLNLCGNPNCVNPRHNATLPRGSGKGLQERQVGALLSGDLLKEFTNRYHFATQQYCIDDTDAISFEGERIILEQTDVILEERALLGAKDIFVGSGVKKDSRVISPEFLLECTPAVKELYIALIQHRKNIKANIDDHEYVYWAQHCAEEYAKRFERGGSSNVVEETEI